MKQKNPEEIVLCPVCGSEKFDQIAEDDITKQAQSYQIEHRDLIETKETIFNKIRTKMTVKGTVRLVKCLVF